MAAGVAMMDVQVHLWARTNEGPPGGGGPLDAPTDEGAGAVARTRCGKMIGGGMILAAAADEAHGAGLPLCEACGRAGAAPREPQRALGASAALRPSR